MLRLKELWKQNNIAVNFSEMRISETVAEKLSEQWTFQRLSQWKSDDRNLCYSVGEWKSKLTECKREKYRHFKSWHLTLKVMNNTSDIGYDWVSETRVVMRRNIKDFDMNEFMKKCYLH